MKKLNWIIVVAIIALILLFVKFDLYVYDRGTGKKLGKFVGEINPDFGFDPFDLTLEVSSPDLRYIDDLGNEYWTQSKNVIVKKKLVFRI